MKVGDIIINPYVSKSNPKYLSMVTNIGTKYTITLRYDGEASKYYTRDIRSWDIVGHVNLYKLIYGEENSNVLL